MTRPSVLLSVLLAAVAVGACARAPVGRGGASGVAGTLILEPIPAYRQLDDCDSRTLAGRPCRLPAAPGRREAERRLGTRAAVAWGGGDRWTLVYRAPDDAVAGVDVVGGVQLPLSRLAGTRLWALALRLPGADSAAISLRLEVRRDDTVEADTALREWRGPLAPPKPPRADPLAGTLRASSLWSEALRAWRAVPADLLARPATVGSGGSRSSTSPIGEGVGDYARVVDPLIASGDVLQVVLVGMLGVGGARPVGGRRPARPTTSAPSSTTGASRRCPRPTPRSSSAATRRTRSSSPRRCRGGPSERCP